MKSITSRRNPIVKRYRDAAAGGDREIVLDGSHLIDEAVRAGVVVHGVACSPRSLKLDGVAQMLDRLESAAAECWTVTDEVLRAISPVRSPSGLVALAARPQVTLAQALHGTRPLVLLVVDVQDPGNVGAIVRAAEAGGATGVVFTGSSADPFAWKALRGSMGSTLRLPVARAVTSEVMTALREARIRMLATTPRASRAVFDVDLRSPVAFLVGGEGPGLPEAVIQAADDTVRIPMRKPVESLNVAVAAALLVYEAARQRESLTSAP